MGCTLNLTIIHTADIEYYRVARLSIVGGRFIFYLVASLNYLPDIVATAKFILAARCLHPVVYPSCPDGLHMLSMDSLNILEEKCLEVVYDIMEEHDHVMDQNFPDTCAI